MNKFIKYIKEKNPSIIIEKYSYNSEGENNDVVIINDEYVFKFPKYQDGIKKLKIEIDVKEIFKNVHEKEDIAKQLATFLKQLHSVPCEEVRSFGVNSIDSHSE